MKRHVAIVCAVQTAIEQKETWRFLSARVEWPTGLRRGCFYQGRSKINLYEAWGGCDYSICISVKLERRFQSWLFCEAWHQSARAPFCVQARLLGRQVFRPTSHDFLKNRKREESAVKVFMAVTTKGGDVQGACLCPENRGSGGIYMSTSATYTRVLNHNLVLLIFSWFIPFAFI